MKKVEYTRILYIDEQIRTGSYPNATTLAKVYEVTPRTIQRDIEYMRNLQGAPIVYDSAKRGYYYSEKGYSLPAITIPEKDIFALFIAERALMQYRNTPFYEKLETIFEKLKSFLPSEITMKTSWIGSRFSFLSESRTEIIPQVWESVSRGLREERKVIIHHQKAGAREPTIRRVNPYHMVSYKGEWYLVAYCNTRKSIIRFAMSRIRKAVETTESFIFPQDFSLENFLGKHFGIITEKKEYTVSIRFTPSQAPYILERQWHKDQLINEESDGSVTITFPSNSLFEVKRWVLSWGSDAVVLKPKALVDAVKDEVETMKSLY